MDNLKFFKGMHRFLPTLFKIEGHTVTEVPIRHNPRGRDMASVGPNVNAQWLAFQSNSAFTVSGIRALPLLPAIILLLLSAMALLLAWRREGR